MFLDLKRLEEYLNFESLKEDFRKIGVNFATSGMIGIFIQHIVGSWLSLMFWSAFCILGIGVIFICFGNSWTK